MFAFVMHTLTLVLLFLKSHLIIVRFVILNEGSVKRTVHTKSLYIFRMDSSFCVCIVYMLCVIILINFGAIIRNYLYII